MLPVTPFITNVPWAPLSIEYSTAPKDPRSLSIAETIKISLGKGVNSTTSTLKGGIKTGA